MTLGVDPHDPAPPFEQLRRQVAALAADGTWPAGHRLPTVRALATELGLAVNTVAKAYRSLETDGVIETRGRAGSVVATRRADDPDATAAAAAYVLASRRAGLTLPEATGLVEQHWYP